MSIEIAVALIAGVPPTVAAALAFLASRSVRRQVATHGEAPIGSVVERLERRVEELDQVVGGIADRLAHLEGWEVLPRTLDHRVDGLATELRNLSDRVARIEARGSTP